jgi:hypothetical protein
VAEMNVGTALELLVASDTPEDHLRKLFEWEFERAMTLVRVGFAVAASLVATFIAAVSKHGTSLLQLLLIAVGAAATGAYSFYRLHRVRKADRDYVAGLDLLRVFGPLTPLLRLYRS